jgi:hypothetical protein
MTNLFAALATSSGHGLSIFLAIGFLIGVVLFVLGFRFYREYRILEDTPAAPIRSIPMGLVHVHGKTSGEDRLTSPLTGVACYYYKVEVEKWVKKEKGGEWERIRTDTAERKFRLDDGSGKVLVDPHNAEYDLPLTFRAEIGLQSNRSRHVDPSLGVPGPSEQDLHAFLTEDASRARTALASMDMPGAKAMGKVLAVEQKLESMGVSLSGGGLSVSLGGDQSYRFTEQCLLAERDCTILGTCAENPSPQDEHDRNLLMRGQNEKTFLITSKTGKQIEKSLRWKAIGLVLLGAAILIGMTAMALHSAGLL